MSVPSTVLIFLFSFLASAMSPQSLCEKPDGFHLWSSQSKRQFEGVCRSAGSYEESALPDNRATTTGKFREGAAAQYDYKDFMGSFSKSLDAVARKEICEPNKTNTKVAYPSVSLENTATGTIPVSVISEQELNQIYQEFANDPRYVFEVPEEGCWARALLMTKALEKRGIRSAKMFAEGPFWVSSKDEQSPDKRWAYHVAPMVAVKTAKGVEMRVIDPSLFDKPVAAKKWGDKMFSLAEEKSTAQLYVTDRFATAPLFGEPLKTVISDPARGRWHKAEVIMAEQELERLKTEAVDRKAMNDFLNQERISEDGE